MSLTRRGDSPDSVVSLTSELGRLPSLSSAWSCADGEGGRGVPVADSLILCAGQGKASLLGCLGCGGDSSLVLGSSLSSLEPSLQAGSPTAGLSGGEYLSGGSRTVITLPFASPPTWDFLGLSLPGLACSLSSDDLRAIELADADAEADAEAISSKVFPPGPPRTALGGPPVRGFSGLSGRCGRLDHRGPLREGSKAAGSEWVLMESDGDGTRRLVRSEVDREAMPTGLPRNPGDSKDGDRPSPYVDPWVSRGGGVRDTRPAVGGTR